MARLNTRASSAAEADDDVRQLDQARNKNDLKLKSRFESIFRKYEHNFEGVGDEIDIHSGEIVVDNGHLQNMRDEADTGKSASSRFVKTFQEKLEHEDEDEEEDEDSESVDEGDSASDGDDEDGQSQDILQPFRALARPPPRLAQLLVGGMPDDQTSQDPSSVEEDSTAATPTGLLDQVPALNESVSALTARSKRPAVDANTIQALGTSIANQLAQLMAGSSKKRKRKSQPKSTKETTDPVWDYPDINHHNTRQKRRRSPAPVAPPTISSPPVASPGQRSLWAPEGSRPSKRFKQAATPSLRRLRSSIIPSSAVKGADLKRCMNCSLTNSSAWQDGPGGGDLCVSCAKYYEHHGRMKPFDSPTPSAEEQDSDVESGSQIDLGEPLVPPTEAIEEDIVEAEPAPRLHDEPVREPSPEAIIMEPAVSNMPPLEENEPVEVGPPDVFLTDTPQTYPANTSRPMTSPVKHAPYTVEEDALLIKVREQDDLPWHVVALQFPQRTQFSIQNRYMRILQKPDCPGRAYYNAQRAADTAAAEQLAVTSQDRRWSHEQDELLLELRDDKDLGWADIASVLPGRSVEAVQNRYDELLQEAEMKNAEDILNARKTPWNPNEDARIVRLKEIDRLTWHQVAQQFDDRSLSSIQQRYTRCLAPEKRRRAPSDAIKGTAEELILEADPDLAARLTPGAERMLPFTPAEDELLRILIEHEIGITWEQLAARVPGRSVRAVYLRCTEHLNIEIKREEPPPKPDPGITFIPYSPLQGSFIRRTDTPPYFSGMETSPVVVKESTPVITERPGPGSRKSFEQSEDDIIMQLKGSKNASWEEIAQHLPGRSVNAISQRFSELLRTMNNNAAASSSSQRPSSSLRRQSAPAQSFISADPRIDLRRYTREEDKLMLELRTQGFDWELMVPYFDSRTPASLEDRWNFTFRSTRARRSMPAAPVSGRAGLLRRALDNSRRRSGSALQERLGETDEPIMIQDDFDSNAPSEQLFGELRSSVLREPEPQSMIDPQLLEHNQMVSSKNSLERLMQAAEKFATERQTPEVVQMIWEIHQKNKEDPRLKNLLELTSSGDSRAALEVAQALEAFEHEHGHAARGAATSATSLEVGQPPSNGKGKGKAREEDLRPQRQRPMAFAQAERLVSEAQGQRTPGLDSTFRPANSGGLVAVANHAHAHQQDSVPATSMTYDITSDSSPDETEPLAPFLSPRKTAPAAPIATNPQPVPQTQTEQRRQEISVDEFQTLQDPGSEESLGVPSRPTHSTSELIHMALAATSSTAMHPKSICNWIETNFEYYCAASPHWKAEILQELNESGEFEQCGNGRARPWRIKTPDTSLKASQLVKAKKRPRRRSAPAKTFHDDYTVPCSDNDADMEDTIVVKTSERKGRRARGKRTTDSMDDLREYTPVKSAVQASVAKKNLTTRSRVSKPAEVEETAPVQAPHRELDRMREIPDSDDNADELSSSPAQKSPPRRASSGKKVRFMDTVEVRGPTCTNEASSTPSLKKSAQTAEEEAEPEGSSSSPAKILATACSAKPLSTKTAVPSSSPGFMKAANKPKAKTTAVAAAGSITPFPKSKTRLADLRRESLGGRTTGTPPRTPQVANWPRRHSTPTAIFSHRGSPAMGRGVLMDRFGFGRKRVVETPVREVVGRDEGEDELA